MFRILFWLLLIVILTLSQMPAADAPTVFADDKINHILAFFVLSFVARIGWPRVDFFTLFILLASFGGGIELLQLGLGFGRQADWIDFGVDAVAILAGLLVAMAFKRASSEPKPLDDNSL